MTCDINAECQHSMDGTYGCLCNEGFYGPGYYISPDQPGCIGKYCIEKHIFCNSYFIGLVSLPIYIN